MLNVLRSEHLNYKRTFMKRLILFAPLVFILISLRVKLFLPDYIGAWEMLLAQIYNWWPVLFLPLGTALLAALAQQKEKKAGKFQNLRIHPVSTTALWTGKIAVLAYHTLLSSCILMVAVLISGLTTAGGATPWSTIVAGGLLMW
ncbi:MAG: ABC transporter permease, partial [Planifilum fulgidum]